MIVDEACVCIADDYQQSQATSTTPFSFSTNVECWHIHTPTQWSKCM